MKTENDQAFPSYPLPENPYRDAQQVAHRIVQRMSDISEQTGDDNSRSLVKSAGWQEEVHALNLKNIFHLQHWHEDTAGKHRWDGEVRLDQEQLTVLVTPRVVELLTASAKGQEALATLELLALQPLNFRAEGYPNFEQSGYSFDGGEVELQNSLAMLHHLLYVLDSWYDEFRITQNTTAQVK